MNSKTYNTQLISILNHIFYNDFIKILVECGGNIPNNLNASIENQEKILVLILNLLCSFFFIRNSCHIHFTFAFINSTIICDIVIGTYI